MAPTCSVMSSRLAAVGHASYAQEPAWFTTAPVGAIDRLQKKLGWSEKDIDLYEINEAFAVVTMAAMHDLKLPHEKVNVNGGACALGHPIGCTGARITVTLLHALKARGGKRGIAASRRSASAAARPPPSAWKCSRPGNLTAPSPPLLAQQGRGSRRGIRKIIAEGTAATTRLGSSPAGSS